MLWAQTFSRKYPIVGWRVSPTKDLSKSQPPVPVNVTLFRNRDFAAVIKLRILRWDQAGFRMDPKSNDWYPYKSKERGIWDKGEEAHGRKQRQRREVGGQKPRALAATRSWNLQEAILPRVLRASRTVNAHISVGLSYQIRGTLLCQPQETNDTHPICFFSLVTWNLEPKVIHFFTDKWSTI